MRKLNILAIIFVLLFIPFVSATCTYESKTNSTDYFNVSSSALSTTAMSSIQLFDDYTFFTPRLNFTRNVSEQFYATMNGSYSYFSWKTPNNFSSSLVVLNGTNVVSATNYSLRNLSATAWVLDWRDSRYNGTLMTVYFNRTFIKNVDDIVVSPSSIYLGATTASFLVQSSPTTYGEDATFQFNGVSAGNLGPYVNVSDWAVGWSYTEKTCVDQGCSAPVNNTLFGLIITVFILGMLVFLGFSIYAGADMKTIMYIVIGFVIMLVALAIFNGMINSICAS